MSQFVGFGVPEEWEYFRSRHERLLPHIQKAKTLADEALKQSNTLSTPLDKVMHASTRLAQEKFMEILLLAGNGYGIASLQLIRTMYEHVTTARFLQLHPEDVDRFWDWFAVSEKKLMDAIIAAFGSDAIPAETQALALREFERVRARYEVTLCHECGRRGTDHKWHTLDFVSMTKKATDVDDLVVPAYLTLLKYTHATASGLIARMEDDGGGIAYRATSHREEASDALILANDLLLRAIAFHIEHFKLEALGPRIEELAKEFSEIWKRE